MEVLVLPHSGYPIFPAPDAVEIHELRKDAPTRGARNETSDSEPLTADHAMPAASMPAAASKHGFAALNRIALSDKLLISI